MERTGATPFVVSVEADPDLIVDRYRRRDRHPGHLDDELLDEITELVQRRYVAPDLGGGSLEVDLTDMSAVDAALDEIAQALEVAAPHALQHRSGEDGR